MTRLLMGIFLSCLFTMPVFAEVSKIKVKPTAGSTATTATTIPIKSTVTSPVTPAAEHPMARPAAAAAQINHSKAAALRNLVHIGPIQFTHVSGDVYSWQATINNVTGAPITGAVLMPSKKVNNSWSPAGDQIAVVLAAGNSTRQGSGAMTGADTFKLDVLARRGGADSPLEVVGSKTVNFTANGADLADNIDVSGLTIVPYDGRFKWTATVTNNNNTAFNERINIDGLELVDGQWIVKNGGSINSLPAGGAQTKSLTFWRDPNSTQFKVVLESNGQVIKESVPVALEPINAIVSIANAQVSKQGGLASWSASITNGGNIQLSNVRVKTYHRQTNEQWTVASNMQNIGTLAIGASGSVNNVFTPGTSTQFKIEVIASSFSENYSEITVGTQELGL